MPSLPNSRSPRSPNSSSHQLAKQGLPQATLVGSDAAPKASQVRFLYPDIELFDPEEFIKDDPAFKTRDAAAILGVPADRLMKWRQRGQGPEYLVYEDGGIRYELSALIAYKASRRVSPSRQSRPRRRS